VGGLKPPQPHPLRGACACAVSLLTLALIALDRCLMVSPRFDYKHTMTAKKKIIPAVVWLLACVYSAIRLTIEKEITSYLAAAAFGLCYVEMIVCYAIVYYRICKQRLTQTEKDYGIMYNVARTVAFSTSAINPALYCFNNKEYRRAFKRILSSFLFARRREEYQRIM